MATCPVQRNHSRLGPLVYGMKIHKETYHRQEPREGFQEGPRLGRLWSADDRWRVRMPLLDTGVTWQEDRNKPEEYEPEELKDRQGRVRKKMEEEREIGKRRKDGMIWKQRKVNMAPNSSRSRKSWTKTLPALRVGRPQLTWGGLFQWDGWEKELEQ